MLLSLFALVLFQVGQDLLRRLALSGNYRRAGGPSLLLEIIIIHAAYDYGGGCRGSRVLQPYHRIPVLAQSLAYVFQAALYSYDHVITPGYYPHKGVRLSAEAVLALPGRRPNVSGVPAEDEIDGEGSGANLKRR